MSDLGPITLVSVNFTARSIVALDKAAELSGDSKTDCLNRAIQIYAAILKASRDGARLTISDTDPPIHIRTVRPWWRFW